MVAAPIPCECATLPMPNQGTKIATAKDRSEIVRFMTDVL